MSDNVTFQGVPATPPAGAVIAADDVGGVLYQRVKLDAGADGLASPVSAANPLPVILSDADSVNYDAFGRLRVSNTDTRFDAEFIYDKQALLFDDISAGAGSIAHNANGRDVVLTLGGSAGADAAGLRQHWYNPYTPGNSQIIAITGVLNGAALAGTAYYFLRSSISGSAVTTTYPQSGWIDATSGVNWDDSQIFLIDFQSLKVGRLRFGLDRNGEIVAVGQITNDNVRATGYWQSANLPVYWRVFNSGGLTVTEIGYGDEANAVGFRFETAANASQTARAICATVKSEGGGTLQNMPGLQFAAGNAATQILVGATLIPVASLQVKATFGGYVNRALAIPENISLVTDNPIYWRLLRNPTLTGGAWSSVSANSILNVNTTATAISGGTVLASGYAGTVGIRSGMSGIGLTGRVPLSLDAAGSVGDILTLAAVRVGTASANVAAEIGWKEIR